MTRHSNGTYVINFERRCELDIRSRAHFSFKEYLVPERIFKGSEGHDAFDGYTGTVAVACTNSIDTVIFRVALVKG